MTVLHFFVQPIQALHADVKTKHYEILVRLIEEEEVVAPMAFIPAAETITVLL